MRRRHLPQPRLPRPVARCAGVAGRAIAEGIRGCPAGSRHGRTSSLRRGLAATIDTIDTAVTPFEVGNDQRYKAEAHDAKYDGEHQFVGQGIARVLGGSVFSIGLMLVVVCGAELFTGNSLLAAAALHGEISWGKLLENWLVVLVGNFIGALILAWLMYETRLWEQGTVADQAVRLATVKCKLSFWVAFVRGILCNWLVCLAIVMATAARNISGKLLACYVPIMVFVASGFEHSIANIYFIPEGIMVAGSKGIADPALSWSNFLLVNLLPVTFGNIIGGVLFVATAYWYVHAAGKQCK